MDISLPYGHMVVDIGGGTTDIAIISLGGIVASNSLKIAGDDYNEAIIKFVGDWNYAKKTKNIFRKNE